MDHPNGTNNIPLNTMEDIKFKMEKFHTNDSGTIKIRCEVLVNGRVIAFGIALTDLAAPKVDGGIDFDKQSDEIIKNYFSSKTNRTFEYMLNNGFIEVDIDKQKWFSLGAS